MTSNNTIIPKKYENAKSVFIMQSKAYTLICLTILCA